MTKTNADLLGNLDAEMIKYLGKCRDCGGYDQECQEYKDYLRFREGENV